MKSLVISGGGAKGSWGGGVAQWLVESGKDYDMYVGTSTGNLLIPLTALKKMDQLKTAYTTVTQCDIFRHSPFKVIKKNGKITSELRYLAIIWNMLVRGQKTFGDSSNLKLLIGKFFTEDDFNTLRKNKKEIFSCVANLTEGHVEYRSSMEESYEDFCDYMYASTCMSPLMSLIDKNGCDYMDGGIFDNIPIQKAIDRGATEIDVIALRPEGGSTGANARMHNALEIIQRAFDCMLKEIGNDDVSIAKFVAKDKDVTLNVYYTPRNLTDNPLIFDMDVMTGWWNEGYAFFQDRRPHKTYKITKNKVTLVK